MSTDNNESLVPYADIDENNPADESDERNTVSTWGLDGSIENRACHAPNQMEVKMTRVKELDVEQFQVHHEAEPQVATTTEQSSTQGEESAATASISESTLNMSEYRYMRVDGEELDQHLIATEQRPDIATGLGGIREGNSPGHPCYSCGNDEPTWLRDKFSNYICRKCLADGRYTLYRWVMDHQDISLQEALALIAQISGFAFRDVCASVKAKTAVADETTRKPYKQYSRWKLDNEDCLFGSPDSPVPYWLDGMLQSEGFAIVGDTEAADCMNRVFLAAGVKCVVATTSPTGVANEEFWKGFVQQHPTIASKRIVIIPDNDEPGMNDARTVAKVFLGANQEASVKIVELNDRQIPKGGGFADWFVGFLKEGKDAFTAIEALAKLCNGTELLTSDIIETWSQAAG